MTDYQAGDWCETPYGWMKVSDTGENVRKNKMFILLEGCKTAYTAAHITAHRSKSGPFKVGDVAESDFGSDGPCPVIRVDEEHVLMKTLGGTNRVVHAHVTLVKPVEAIQEESEYANETDLTDEPDLNDVDAARMAARLEKLGYVVMPPDDDGVTIEDLPEIGCVDDGDNEWLSIADEIHHGGNIVFYLMKPKEILDYFDRVCRVRIASGAIDNEVKQRMEVIS